MNCFDEAVPKIPAPASEATVTLSLAHEVVATSRDEFAVAFRRDVAASLGVDEGAVFVLTTSADPTAVDFSVAGAGDVAGILRESGLSTTHLTYRRRRGWRQDVPTPVAGGRLRGDALLGTAAG